MAETTNYVKYNTRIQLKYDTWANWNKESFATTFIPLAGEVCIVEIPKTPDPALSGTDAKINPPVCLIKVGDGKTTFKALPWLSATAADVHEWAKQSEQDFIISVTETGVNVTKKDAQGKDITVNVKLATDAQISTLREELNTAVTTTIPGLIDTAIDTLGSSLAKDQGSTSKTITGIVYNATTGEATVTYADIAFPEVTLPTVDTAMSDSSENAVQNKVIKSYVDAEVQELTRKVTNAMHFIGITEEDIADENSTLNPIKIIVDREEGTTKEVTAIAGDVVIKEGYEFVWTGDKWERLGQDSSFIVTGTKFTNTDIADKAAIDPTKIGNTLTLPEKDTREPSLKTDIELLSAQITAHNDDYNVLNGVAWKSTLSTEGDSKNVYATASGAVAGKTADLTIGNIPVTCLVFSCGGAGED